MSLSLMSGFCSDEQKEDLIKIFKESKTSSEFVKKFIPGDTRIFFCGTGDFDDCWLELKNVNGRLHLEIGEGAA